MRWLLGSFLLVGLSVACTVESKKASDDDGGTSSSGNGSGGFGGSAVASTASTSSTGGYGGGCQGLCAKVGDAMCPNDSESACLTECNGLYTQAPNCMTELDAMVNCQAASGTVSCDGEGDAKVEGCDAEGLAFFDCLMGGGGGGACYEGAGDCNPLTDSCAPGDACDMAQDNAFHCFPPPNDVPVGGACDAAAGPWCQHGAACVGGVCRAYCCEQSDCTTGTCQVFGSGTVQLKACM